MKGMVTWYFEAHFYVIRKISRCYPPLKGTVSRDFRPSAFHKKKIRFAYGFVSAEKIKIIVFKVWIPRCQWHREIGSRGVNDTSESDPALSMTTRDSTWEFFKKRFCSLNEIHCLLEAAGFDPAVSMTPRKSLWHRGLIRENDYWLWFPLRETIAKRNKYLNITYI
jgi:hypothetical protein